MASPFSFFRKNQQSMMVVLVILAMLVFTLDSVFSSRENQFVVLGLLLGGVIFAVAGISRGRWMQYGAGGAILGALCGWLLPPWLMSVGDRPAVISSSLGAFDDKRVYDLQLQRGLANQFMFRVTEAAYGQGMGQFASSFGFGHQSEREDVVFGELMRSEADDLNIVVTNEMVTAFINLATDNKLTRQAFAKARSAMSVEGKKLTDEMLFDVLRSEIKAQIAFLTLHPQSSVLYQAPEVAYSMFRRLNVSQKMNTAMIDVDAFLDLVPNPGDAEVADFFEKHRLRSPNEIEPGSPGFRQPRKVKLGYLEVDYKKVEESVPAVTDQDVEDFYNENREILYRRPVAPDVPEQKAPPAESTETPATPDQSDVPEKSDAAPAKPTEDPKPEEPKPEEPKPEEPKPEEPKPEEPKPEEPKPEEPKPEDPKPEDPKPEEPKPEEPKPEEPKPEEPASEPECGISTDEGTAAVQIEESAAGDAPTADAPAADAQATPGEPSSPTLPASDDGPPALTIPAELSEGQSSGASQEEEPMFPEQKFEIRPLDDDLKAQIRDQLLGRRVGEAIEARMAEIMQEMKLLEDARLSHRLKLKAEFIKLNERDFAAKIAEYTPQMIAEAKKLAEKSGAVYVETPFISGRELFDAESYPIGRAVAPAAGQSAAGAANVVTTIFSAPPGELQYFRPRRAVLTSFDLDSGETHFGWWIIDDSESHVPTLDEAGIREEVILSWKRLKARELAKQRAEKLAATIREGLTKPDDQRVTMQAALENVTTTGEDDAARIAVRQTEQFTWMRQPFNPQMDFRQQPRPVISQITFAGAANETLELAFDDFMEVVFEDLQNEEVGVVPNGDLSRYYVVHIIERTPTPEVGEDSLRQRFLTEAGRGLRQSPSFMLMRDNIEMPTVSEWETALWLKYGVDRSIPLDE